MRALYHADIDWWFDHPWAYVVIVVATVLYAVWSYKRKR